jgi:hypothetical protein
MEAYILPAISMAFSREVLKKTIMEANNNIINVNIAPGLERTAATIPTTNLPTIPPLSGENAATSESNEKIKSQKPMAPLAVATGSLTLSKYNPVITKEIGTRKIEKPR